MNKDADSVYTLLMISLEPRKMQGTVEVPASKSQTIRAFLIAAAAEGTSIIRHPLISSDTLSCIEAVKAFGTEVHFSNDCGEAEVISHGLSAASPVTVDAGNSGTTTYLLLPMAASLAVPVTVTGDEQMRRRPTLPLSEAIRALGAEAHDTDGKPPVTVKGPLRGGHVSIECRTSQYLSGLLLAAPLASGPTVIDCPILYEKPYVSLTLGWLDRQGIRYTISEDYMHSEVEGGQEYRPFDEYINGDFSSASFFFVAAAISGTSITVQGLDRNDPQGDKAILDVLEKMGCMIAWNGNSVTVTGPEKLSGGTFDLNAIPDTLPVLAVAAAAAHGTVKLTNVPQARIKETDRIRCMRENLERLGVEAEEEPDGLIIHGTGSFSGGRVQGYGDHRIIMAMAVASAAADSAIEIDDEKAAAVTFPSFFSLLETIRR